MDEDLQADSLASLAGSRFKKVVGESFTPRMVGFALSRAWVYVVFFNSALLLDKSSAGNPTLDTMYAVSLMALIVILIIGGIINTRCDELIRTTPGMILPALLSIIGTGLLPFATISTQAGMAFTVASGITTGLGSGMLSLYWGRIYGHSGGPIAAAETAIAFIVATLLVPLFIIVPLSIQVSIVTILPIASTVILIRELKTCWEEERIEAEEEASHTTRHLETIGLNWKRVLLKISTGSIVFGFVVSMMRAVYSLHETDVLGLDFNLILPASAIVSGFIMLLVLLFSRRLDLAFSYRPVLLFMSLGCFCLPFLEGSGMIAWLLTMSGYFCFEIMNWVMLSDISLRFGLSAYQVFGFGRAAVSGGVLFGAITGGYLNTSVHMDGTFSTALSFAMAFLMIVTYTFTLTERDVARITRQRRRFPAEHDARSDDDVPVHEFDLDDKLGVLADRFDISERSMEVLGLLARGRTAKRIEQELYMSKGTVNTHMRRLYQKLGVHTRQELLDVIDAVDDPDVHTD